MGEMDLGLGSCRNNFVEWRSDRRNVLSTGRIPQYARPRRLELMIHVGANDFNTVTISASITSIGRIQRMMLPPTANEYSRPDAVISHWRLCGTETHTRCRACTIARIHNEISSAHLVLNSITNTPAIPPAPIAHWARYTSLLKPWEFSNSSYIPWDG